MGATRIIPNAARPARTSVVAAAADTALLAAAGREAVVIFNESTAVLYLGIGDAAVSLTNYTVQIPASGSYTVPQALVSCAIRGYWAAANGSARITVG